MYFRLTDTEFQEILLEHHIPVEQQLAEGISEQQLELQHPRLGAASSHQMGFEGVLIGYGSLRLHQHVQLDVESDLPVLQMIFNLSGNSQVYIRNRNKKLAFDHNEHNMLYMPSLTGSFALHKQAEHLQTFKITLTESYFKRLAGQGPPLLQEMCRQMEEGKMCSMGGHNLDISPQMAITLQAMQQCHTLGNLKRLFLESKVIELLMLQVGQYERYTAQKEQAMRPLDVEKIYHARDIIASQPDALLSLAGLARQTGLNEFKLKKGFKTLLGTTVFGYVRELRMGRARSLITDTDKSILEISEEIGYKHPHHFAVAFKKQFGLLPSELRK